MKYYFFNYSLKSMRVRDKCDCQKHLSREDFAVLEKEGKLDIGHGLWMLAVLTY